MPSLSNNRQKIYFNNPQQEIMYTGAHTTVVAGGRRVGKTHGINAPYLLRMVQHMPGSSGGIVAATFQQALTKTLPSTLAALSDLGYYRDIHYVVGKRPPKHLNFAKPKGGEPADCSHVVWFYNGTIAYIISLDVQGSANSLTLDWLLVDEAKFIKFEKLKEEVLPANGGTKRYFGNHPMHHAMMITSDMPTTKSGSWFLNYEDKMDEDLIKGIQGTVFEIWRIKQEIIKKGINTYNSRRLYELRQKLAKLQSVAVFYREISTIENIQILGEKYIRQMKRDLPPLVFQTSILCRKVEKLKDGFYPSLSSLLHYYTAYNNTYLVDLAGEALNKPDTLDCRQDGDMNDKDPLLVAFDYNANINWLVVGQTDGMRLKTINSFFVKYHRKLRELVQDFCNYYRFKSNKTVVYYYNTTALGSNYAVSDQDFSCVVTDEFEKQGWKVIRVFMGVPLKHHEKYIMIDQALKGQKYLLPQFNQHKNEALLLALQQAGVRIGSNGFQKNKTGEKYAETEEDMLEYRTDGTDAWDDLFVGVNLYPYRINSTTPSTFMGN